MISPWRREAWETIEKAKASGKALELEGRELRRHVSKAYPFGERKQWPYKVWLSEMRRHFGRSREVPGRTYPLFAKLEEAS